MPHCPVPACDCEAPDGCVFCPEHFIQIPRAYTSLIARTKFMCQRASADDERLYLHEQTQAYIQSAIRLLNKDGKNVA